MLINSRARQKTLSYVSLTSWRPHGKRRQKHARCFEGDSSAACSSMIEPECLCYRQFMNQTGSSSSNLDVKHGCRKDTSLQRDHAVADGPAPIVVPDDGGDRTTSRGRAPQRMRARGWWGSSDHGTLGASDRGWSPWHP